MLPQSAWKRVFVIAVLIITIYYNCYKEVLGPIYPGQTTIMFLISFQLLSEHGPHLTKEVVVDTSLSTACLVTNPSEIDELNILSTIIIQS